MDEQKPNPAPVSEPPDDLQPLPTVALEDNSDIPKHTHVPHATYNVHQPKKKHKKKLLFLLVLLIAVAGAYYYFNEVNKQVKQTAIAPAPVEEAPKPDDRLFYQVGSKVISYNADTKQEELLSDQLPATARVLDVYADDKSWRLYAENRVEDGAKVQLIYLEKSSDPRVLVTETEIGQAVANAEQQLVGYSQYATNVGNLLPTRTVVIRKDGKKQTVYSSSLVSATSDQLGLKDPLYSVADISDDGTKLLFQRSNCYMCDGGTSATSFELDLNANRPTPVYTATKAQGSIQYFNGGFLISETDSPGLGALQGPYKDQFLTLDKIGGVTKPLFTINEKDWAAVDFAAAYQTLVVDRRAPDYPETLKTVFDGFYEMNGSTTKNLKKLTISSGIKFASETLSLGNKKADCFAALTSSRDTNAPTKTSKVGTLCKDAANTYSFTAIDSLKQELSSFQNVQVLD